MVAGQPSSSATSRLTTSFPRTPVARTTLKTCSSSALTATGSRTTVLRSTWWPGSLRWGLRLEELHWMKRHQVS